MLRPLLEIPQVIEYNRLLIAQYGLNIEDINRIVNTALLDKALVWCTMVRNDLI
jgi:Cu/Ag efflux pump CusA